MKYDRVLSHEGGSQQVKIGRLDSTCQPHHIGNDLFSTCRPALWSPRLTGSGPFSRSHPHYTT